jgi:serine/threonine protein kinase
MALYTDGQWFNLGIRAQLLENPAASRDIQSPDQRFLYYVIDYPLEFLPNVVGQLTKGSAFTVEKEHGSGGAFAEISLKPKRGESPSGALWYSPIKREPTAEQRKSGLHSSSIRLVSSGQSLNEILEPDLRTRLDSKLRLADPAYDGVAGLAKRLFPGTGFENWQQTLVEVVAELPFEIESTNGGKLVVRASSRAKDGLLTTICFYEPQTGVRPPRTVLRRDEDAELFDSGLVQWERILDWPEGAERAKVALFYQEEEIQSIQVSRRPPLKDLAKPLKIQSEKQAPVLAPVPESKQPASPMSARGMRIFKTALERYRTLEIVGTGGAGVVYKVESDDGQIFALKLLNPDKATSKNRKRFKTELHFCANNEHKNIITVLDHGVATTRGEDSPFYVMPYYSKTLRDLMKQGITHERILTLFCQTLDAVEAAHLKKVWHRDLKPENVLYDAPSDTLLVADFGIAHFGEEELYTLVETSAHDRLANFQYAAPEQRARGGRVDHRADIFALGLILNEMFTRHVPQGSGFMRISHVAPKFSYVDEIVDRMVRQSPDERPSSIGEIKGFLRARGNEFISRQKLDALRQAVVPSTTVIDPLVQNPIQVEAVDIREGALVASLSQAPSPDWIRAFVHPRSMSYIAGTEPANWNFRGKEATVTIRHVEGQVQQVLDHFKDYVRGANTLYRELLEQAALQREESEKRELQQAIVEEERRQRILNNLRI